MKMLGLGMSLNVIRPLTLCQFKGTPEPSTEMARGEWEEGVGGGHFYKVLPPVVWGVSVKRLNLLGFKSFRIWPPTGGGSCPGRCAAAVQRSAHICSPSHNNELIPLPFSDSVSCSHFHTLWALAPEPRLRSRSRGGARAAFVPLNVTPLIESGGITKGRRQVGKFVTRRN